MPPIKTPEPFQRMTPSEWGIVTTAVIAIGGVMWTGIRWPVRALFKETTFRQTLKKIAASHPTRLDAVERSNQAMWREINDLRGEVQEQTKILQAVPRIEEATTRHDTMLEHIASSLTGLTEKLGEVRGAQQFDRRKGK